jgi:hypothetical protein
MRGEILADKRADGRGGRRLATWNTRRLPTRLTEGWTNRLFVACAGVWRGYFPLSGDVVWTPTDEAAPYALIFDPRQWTPIAAVPAPPFRGWRYLDSPPGTQVTPNAAAQRSAAAGRRPSPSTLEEDARLSAGAPSPTGYIYFSPTGRDKPGGSCGCSRRPGLLRPFRRLEQ